MEEEVISPEETETLQTEVVPETPAPEEPSSDDLHGENLGDRVKVLSPMRTVMKRFFRSKLSIVGLVIIIALFLISFFGPLFSPWGEMEPDKTPKTMVTAQEIRYTDDEGNSYGSALTKTVTMYSRALCTAAEFRLR